MKFALHLLIAAATSLASGALWAAEIAIIANPKANFDSITISQVRQLFMAKSRTLPDEQNAVTFMQVEESPARVAFDRIVLQRSPRDSRAYWAQLIFTGRGQPPSSLPDDASVKEQVALYRNALGYILRESVDDSVKVVLVLPYH
ncbi:conserved hypothetical protein [gamma proteobacterium HdN1]|nr:conserved hypothetical protein [gamma proteobacterium HdN1]